MRSAGYIDNIDQVNVDSVMSGQLTAAEAAARLGVKRSTLYAYVSRGLISRTVALDGRTSLFDAGEVEELRAGRRSATEGQLATLITTKLTRVTSDSLLIRGKTVEDLLDGDASFQAAVDHLWNAGLNEPWPQTLDGQPGEKQTKLVLEGLVDESMRPLDQLRIITATRSSADPLRHDLSPRSVRTIGRELITAMVLGMPLAHQRSASERSKASQVWPTDSGLSLADHLWVRLSSRKGSQDQRRALSAALVALVDHGLAGSTFAARVAASVRADPYSVVLAGLGALGGALHGAASAPVHQLFEAAAKSTDIADAVGHAQQTHGQMPGFGHSVYEERDPRCAPVLDRVEAGWAEDPRLQVIAKVEDIVTSRTDTFPNIDFALGALSWLGHMKPEAGEAIFAISRSAGWLAHASEEYGEQPLRFRSRARYVAE